MHFHRWITFSKRQLTEDGNLKFVETILLPGEFVRAVHYIGTVTIRVQFLKTLNRCQANNILFLMKCFPHQKFNIE